MLSHTEKYLTIHCSRPNQLLKVGGFAGTIQVYLPAILVEGYRKLIEPVFGKGSAKILTIRSEGAVYINSYFNAEC